MLNQNLGSISTVGLLDEEYSKPVKNMPATTTKRCPVWTGHDVDCGKDMSFISNDYNIVVYTIVQLS